MTSPLRDLVIERARDALDAACDGRPEDHAAAIADLRPVLRGTAVIAILGDAREVSRIDPRLYLLGTVDADAERAMANAYRFAAQLLEEEGPLLIVEVVERARTAKQHEEIDGLSVVELGNGDLADPSTLAHEFAHALVASGHRMLDEGIAEWVGAVHRFGDPAAARAALSRQSAGAPSADVIAARSWEAEPAFESLGAPPMAAHARAAIAIADFIDRRGVAALRALARQVRENRVQDLRALLDLDGTQGGDPDPAADEAYAEIRHAFRRGEATGAGAQLPAYRKRNRHDPDDRALVEAYLKLLLLEAGRTDADDLRAEMDAQVDAFLARDSESPFAFVLCICREAHRMRFAADFLQLNDSFGRARAITDAALELHGDDVDVLATAAKLELRTPIEYGGNPRRARNLLLKAAALSTDRATVTLFETAPREIAAPREAA